MVKKGVAQKIVYSAFDMIKERQIKMQWKFLKKQWKILSQP